MNIFNRLLKKHAKTDSENFLWLRIASTVLFFALAAFSLYGITQAYSMPNQVEKEVALVTYQHNGQFDYLVYVHPSHLYDNPVETSAEGESSLYFTNIIDDITAKFDYDFTSDGPLTNIETDAEIVAIITGPSGWQKEITLDSATGTGSSLTVTFPLELEQFNEIINDIEDELEIRRAEYTGENIYQLVIEARVDITANTGSRQIEDTFVQPMVLNIGRGTLSWDDALALSQRRTVDGFSYKHQGSFSYTIELDKNSLYQANVDTLTSEPYQWPSLYALEPGDTYFLSILDVMLADFSYQFICDKPLNDISQEIEVKAILEFPGVWSKTFTLVSKTNKSGEARVDFAVDIRAFNELASTIRSEISLGPPTHNLTIMAEVHTVAVTDFGNIDEVFTHSLEGTLGSTVLTWNNKLESSQAGSITSPQMVLNSERFIGLSIDEARIVFPITAAITLPFAIYLLAVSMAYRPPPPPKLEREARRAKKKHKGLIVDVKELPHIEGVITVIPLDSLDDLLTTAESLFKPVLHKVEGERHTYWVIDGSIRYQYISEELPKQVKPTNEGSV